MRLAESRAGAAVTLRADTTPADALPAPIAQVEFYADDQLLGADVAAPFELVWRPAAGTHRVAALVAQRLAAAPGALAPHDEWLRQALGVQLGPR